MKLDDVHSENMTMQALDAGDGLNIHLQYDNSAHGIKADLDITLDDHAQEQLLREWLAIRFKQQGHGALARALRRAPADMDVMKIVAAAVAVEVSR